MIQAFQSILRIYLLQFDGLRMGSLVVSGRAAVHGGAMVSLGVCSPRRRRRHACRPDSALQRTLAQLTANGAGVAMYSDQPPYYRYKYT